jgi:hypothetical protein
MTIFHPRVGFDIQEVNAGGTSDPGDATIVDIAIGRTMIFVSPAVGWSAGSGLPPGTIKLNGASPGDVIDVRAGDAGAAGVNVPIYLPDGDTLRGSATTHVSIVSQSSAGATLHMAKVSATEWVVS